MQCVVIIYITRRHQLGLSLLAMLKNLPIIPSQTSQKFYQLFSPNHQYIILLILLGQ